MQILSNHKKSLVQRLQRIRVFLTSERSIDWSKLEHTVTGYWASNKKGHDVRRTRRLGTLLNQIKPLWFVNFIRNGMVLFIVMILTYTYLAVQRWPQADKFEQSVNIYRVHDVERAAKLFGHKDIGLSKVQLTGLISHDTSLSGFAIFEVDGRNSGAIAIGETFDKGYFLKSIGVDSVEIVFQGKQYQISMMTKPF
jgi:hypothetical protein